MRLVRWSPTRWDPFSELSTLQERLDQNQFQWKLINAVERGGFGGPFFCICFFCGLSGILQLDKGRLV